MYKKQKFENLDDATKELISDVLANGLKGETYGDGIDTTVMIIDNVAFIDYLLQYEIDDNYGTCERRVQSLDCRDLATCHASNPLFYVDLDD